MIDKIDFSGNDYKIEDSLRKYASRRLGKLDRYLPRKAKDDVVMKVMVTEVGKNKTEKYEITATMELTGGKVITAKDECSNVFAGVDLIEAKLAGQIRRYKLEVQPHRQKRNWRDLFTRRK